ncbi:hypothetical protein KNP414_04457 [Paenibacillus mucilaginosus KNP414]|uniref:Uncharacterized protein n=1 Tax=Paenibacillus mucilaginosus (strain KNP414) TaxID=1036673 RepID=F8F960_PAEMK|nr:hypothetical protein KNP414_04457 [Paenibacillus mucilaginosus KNP414]
MDSGTHFYCCRCSKVEPKEDALNLFSTGHRIIEGQKYSVGYCVTSEFLLHAYSMLEEDEED